MLHQDSFRSQSATQFQPDEHGSPLRLLVISYGLAAAISGLAAVAGVGIWTSLLVFWLGGAMTVFAVGLIAIACKPKSARTDQAWIDVEAPSAVF